MNRRLGFAPADQVGPTYGLTEADIPTLLVLIVAGVALFALALFSKRS